MRPRSFYTLFQKTSVYYYYCYDSTGKRLCFSTGKKNRIEAENEVLRRIKNNQLIPVQYDKTIFSSFAENFFDYEKSFYIRKVLLSGGRYSERTAQYNKQTYNKWILPFFGKKVLASIKTKDINAFTIHLLEKNLSPKSTKNILAILRTIFNEAVKSELITINPCLNAEKVYIAGRQKTRGILNKYEIERLFNKDIWTNETHFLLNFLAYKTGARLGELLALTSKEILEDRIIIAHTWDSRNKKLIQTKTKKSKRMIPITKEVYRKLKKQINKSTTFIFHADDSIYPLSQHSVLVALKSTLKKIGITEEERRERGIVFHSWRHCFNSEMINKGIPKELLQGMTGHSTDLMTENYYHYDIETARKFLS